MTGTAEPNHVMSSGFNVQSEITKLAQRVVEPVAAKLNMLELEHVVGRIGRAFEQCTTQRTTADTVFENMAVSILEPFS
jgi:hypothetical protein